MAILYSFSPMFAAHVSFAIDVTDMSSSCSDKASSAAAATSAATQQTSVVVVSQNGGGNPKMVTKPPVNTIVVNHDANVNRSSATSTITSDYFSMNSEKKSMPRITPIGRTACQTLYPSPT